jgi:uncharacterized membrane protein YdjX (TVP38/TMEM64 family)
MRWLGLSVNWFSVVGVDVWSWMEGLIGTYGYFGAMMIAIVGNLTIFIPVPFAVFIYAFGAILDPILLGLVTGVGSTIGEFSSYLVGRGGRKLIEDKYGRRLESARALVERFGMPAIFLFALLPMPDDLILIPMGMMRYSVRKAFAAMFLGKLGMGLVIAYAGRYSFGLVRDLFESGGTLSALICVTLLALLLFAIIKIDWTRFVKDPSVGK